MIFLIAVLVFHEPFGPPGAVAFPRDLCLALILLHRRDDPHARAARLA